MNQRRTTRTALAVSLICAATAWGATSTAATTVPGTEPPGTDAGAGAAETTEAGASQQVAATSGDLCTYEDYGVEHVDLAERDDRVRPVRARSEPVPHRRDPVDP